MIKKKKRGGGLKLNRGQWIHIMEYRNVCKCTHVQMDRQKCTDGYIVYLGKMIIIKKVLEKRHVNIIVLVSIF